MQLEHHQAAGPVNISDAFLEEKQWDMEAMVLSTIAGQIEDEEEEEEEQQQKLDPVEKGDECDECDEGAFEGWALEFRGYKSAGCRDLSGEGGCAAAHTSTPSQAVSRVGSSDGSRLPTSGTAQERKEQHFKMASEQGHTAFACGCRIARARGTGCHELPRPLWQRTVSSLAQRDLWCHRRRQQRHAPGPGNLHPQQNVGPQRAIGTPWREGA